MAKGRVLIIESDDWESTLLAKILRDADYEVSLAADARSGFDRVRELEPDCILCDVNLPDIDGFWVARRVRAEAGKVGATPFLFLTDAHDVEARLQGLHVGADLFLLKPFRAAEVVAQLGALVELAKRLSSTRPFQFSAEEPPSSAGPQVLQGDIAELSIATVLTLLELERRTGRLKVREDGGRVARIELADGGFASARIDEKAADGVVALRELLSWKRGKFDFRAAPVQSSSERQNLSGLLLSAMQLHDESKR